MYGGIYADFDSIWIRPIPLHYPVPSASASASSAGSSNNNHNKWQGKKHFRVHTDERIFPGGRQKKTNNFFYTSNGIVGGIKHSVYFRQILEWMPLSYDPKSWTGIGDGLFERSLRTCNCTDDFVVIPYLNMYGVFGRHSPGYYKTPLLGTEEDNEALLHHVMNDSYQLHLFGSKTEAAIKRPVNGSLYWVVLDRLGIS